MCGRFLQFCFCCAVLVAGFFFYIFPGAVLVARFFFRHHPGCLVDQAFSCLRVTVEDYVFNASEQFRFDLVIYLEHGRVDDGHVESRFDCVVKER